MGERKIPLILLARRLVMTLAVSDFLATYTPQFWS
jgi:hypothetical protein